MSKLYNVSGGMPLHDARRILGVRIIAHTGRVNAYARCMGGKLRGAGGVAEARRIMASSVQACGGTPGGKRQVSRLAGGHPVANATERNKQK